jgi:hypothetical protein
MLVCRKTLPGLVPRHHRIPRVNGAFARTPSAAVAREGQHARSLSFLVSRAHEKVDFKVRTLLIQYFDFTSCLSDIDAIIPYLIPRALPPAASILK